MLTTLFLMERKINDKEIAPKSDKAIVLDLDLTLLRTFDEEDIDVLFKNDSLKGGDYADIIYTIPEKLKNGRTGTFATGVKRPHVRQFLEFCISYFKYVCVWSAGTREYVLKIVKMLFKDLPSPHLIYTRDDCAVDSEGYYYKPLQKMINDPLMMGKINERNTFILDDTPDTYMDNVENAILIPKYDVKPDIESIEKMDHIFFMLIWYFTNPKVYNSTDIRDLDKPNLFCESV